ncbi:MAG: squalene--hopene cyclase [Planctomycetes bacterium]|nr:squalene--hopene cyclase [Planctomycetota bacterium]
MTPDRERLEHAYETTLAALLAERHPEGYWTGDLATSALSTATAVSALSLVRKQTSTGRYDSLITRGLTWLAEHQNPDGGWGDTVRSISNISTAMLGRAAIHLAGVEQLHGDSLRRVEEYLRHTCGPTAEEQAEAVRARYGKDRTFAVPILTTCALAGLVKWDEVTPLPFELACFPQSWFRFLQLPVVSYALPALIAIGQAVYHHRPPRNPITRLVRRWSIRKSLRVLEAIQPSSGGFLEAVPLTSFVTLSLASIGLAEHPVAKRGVQFLVQAVRPDGSWAIDSNLSVWVTTLSINALAAAGELSNLDRRTDLRDWLVKQQFRERHPYTGAAPGAWGWTHLPGSVPDADDTPGAILALEHLEKSDVSRRSMVAGLRWLLRLQNRDGGWPTFCRGWGYLPFDRSGPDLTAHALRALGPWTQRLLYTRSTGLKVYYPSYLRPVSNFWTFHRALQRGLRYLAASQRPDGSWLPLWFGNQYAADDENPTYGTARVLAAYRDLDKMTTEPARKGVAWLLSAQNADGGWGGAAGVPSSIEETALAVEVLLEAGPETATAVHRALAWLVNQVEAGGLSHPTPIGFYFAKLWYYERLYPVIFTLAALGRARARGPYRLDRVRLEHTP